MKEQGQSKLAAMVMVVAFGTGHCGSGGGPRPEVLDAVVVTGVGARDLGLDAGTLVDVALNAGVFVDIGYGLIYDRTDDVTWLSDGLAFSNAIKATTANPSALPYTGPLIGATVGTHAVGESDFTFVSSMGERWFATWYGGVAWANTYVHGWKTKSIRGWRLPTVTELDNLYRETGGACCGADGCDSSPGKVAPFLWIPPKAWTSSELQYVDFTHDALRGVAGVQGFSNVWVVVAGNVAAGGNKPDAGEVDALGGGLVDAAGKEDRLAGEIAGGRGQSTDAVAAIAAEISISVAVGDAPGTANVDVVLGDTSDGIASMVVTVAPDNLTVSMGAASLTVAGLTARISHSFALTAMTRSGKTLTATTSALAFYDVVETFVEPECTHDTVFTGSFTFDEGSRAVSNLRGTLTEAMFDGPPTVALAHQRSVESVELGGIIGHLITTFALTTTDTFVGGGFAPGGSKTFGNSNAYAMIFVPIDNPARPLAVDQIDWLAYADCTSLGLMGKTCMTGTSVRAYGRLGTMAAYPTSQVTTQR